MKEDNSTTQRPWPRGTSLKNVSRSIEVRHSHAAETLAEHSTAHLLHHFSGLYVLLQQLIDLLDRGSAPSGNSFSPAPVNDLMMSSLPGGH